MEGTRLGSMAIRTHAGPLGLRDPWPEGGGRSEDPPPGQLTAVQASTS